MRFLQKTSVFIFLLLTGLLLTFSQGIAQDFNNQLVYLQAKHSGNNLVAIAPEGTRQSIELRQGDESYSADQVFKFIRTENLSESAYYILNAEKGAYLHIAPRIGDHVVLRPKDGSKNQKWQVIHQGNGYYQIRSKLNNNYVFIPRASQTIGAKAFVGALQNQDHYLFKIIAKADAPEPPTSTVSSSTPNLSTYATNFSFCDDFDYVILAKHINKALDYSNTPYLQIKKYSGDFLQKFRFVNFDGKYFNIRMGAKALHLDIEKEDVKSGAKVIIKDWDFSSNFQKWFLQPASDGYFFIIPKEGESKDLVLDVEGAGTADGTKLILWKRNGNPNQLFKSIFHLSPKIAPQTLHYVGHSQNSEEIEISNIEFEESSLSATQFGDNLEFSESLKTTVTIRTMSTAADKVKFVIIFLENGNIKEIIKEINPGKKSKCRQSGSSSRYTMDAGSPYIITAYKYDGNSYQRAAFTIGRDYVNDKNFCIF